MQASDHSVFFEIQSGQIPAFEMLFKTHYAPLCRYALAYLKDQDEAEEVVQGVFVGFWEKRSTLNIDSSLKAYLYRSVRNACLNELKHGKVVAIHQSTLLAGEEQTSLAADEITLHNELEAKVRAAIDRLPEQCRLIFTMSRFEELKYQEIADQLQLSVKTVENQMGKALKLMRVYLKDYLPLIALFMNGLLKP